MQSSLRREANDGRQRELARRLENKLANVAKNQCLYAWYQSLTSSLFFLANELERTSSLSGLGPVAQIDDWVGGNSTRVSVCASLWVGRDSFEVYHECELIHLASEARLLLSQVVDRVGRIEVPPPLAAAFMHMYRLTGGSISGLLRKRATANPFTRASCSSWSSNGHTSTTVWQKIRSVPHFLQPPAIDKGPESNAKMYVNQRRDERARTWKHTLRHEDFRAKYRYVGVSFERRFRPLSVGRFFSDQRESISRCPKSPFPSKTQNRQIARTSPF